MSDQKSDHRHTKEAEEKPKYGRTADGQEINPHATDSPLATTSMPPVAVPEAPEPDPPVTRKEDKK